MGKVRKGRTLASRYAEGGGREDDDNGSWESEGDEQRETSEEEQNGYASTGDGERTASDGSWTLKIAPPESSYPSAGSLSLRANFHDFIFLRL